MDIMFHCSYGWWVFWKNPFLVAIHKTVIVNPCCSGDVSGEGERGLQQGLSTGGAALRALYVEYEIMCHILGSESHMSYIHRALWCTRSFWGLTHFLFWMFVLQSLVLGSVFLYTQISCVQLKIKKIKI